MTDDDAKKTAVVADLRTAIRAAESVWTNRVELGVSDVSYGDVAKLCDSIEDSARELLRKLGEPGKIG